MVTLDITFPIASEEELVNKFEQTLLAHPNIKLTVIGEWVVSNFSLC